MNFVSSQAESGFPAATSRAPQTGTPRNDQLKDILQALAIPFDLTVVQWRITEYSDDGMRGLMLPYADPRAYTDGSMMCLPQLGGAADIPCTPAHRCSAAEGARLRRSWSHAK